MSFARSIAPRGPGAASAVGTQAPSASRGSIGLRGAVGRAGLQRLEDDLRPRVVTDRRRVEVVARQDVPAAGNERRNLRMQIGVGSADPRRLRRG